MTSIDRLEAAKIILEVSVQQADGYRREGKPESERLACAASNTGYFILRSLGFEHDEIQRMDARYRESAQS